MASAGISQSAKDSHHVDHVRTAEKMHSDFVARMTSSDDDEDDNDDGDVEENDDDEQKEIDLDYDGEGWLLPENEITPDYEYFPRIVAIFYSIFHPTKGPSVIFQVPEGSVYTSKQKKQAKAANGAANEAEDAPVKPLDLDGDGQGIDDAECSDSEDDRSAEPDVYKRMPPHKHEALFDFRDLSEYIIPRAPLCGRLISYSTTSQRGQSYKIVSHPVLLVDQQKYPRNSFIFNLSFVFDGRADVRAYEPIVRKCARELKNLEQDSSFLSRSQYRMYELIEQLFQDLNSYYESFIAMPSVPHSKYMSEAVKTAELLRGGIAVQHVPGGQSMPITTPKTWHDTMQSAPRNNKVDAEAPQLSALSQSTTSSPTTMDAATFSLTSDDLTAAKSISSPIASANGTESVTTQRPIAKRSITETSNVTVVPPFTSPSRQSTTSSGDTMTSPTRGQSGSSDSRRKDSSASANQSLTSTPSRPMNNRTKTVAALGLSGTTVTASNASNSSGTAKIERALSSDEGIPTIANSTLRSPRKTQSGGTTGEKELIESIASLRSVVAPPFPSTAMSKVDSSGDASSRRSTDKVSTVGAAAPVVLPSSGKREPPHGLGRTVRDALNVKLFPTYANPKDVNDWDVPVTLLDLTRSTSDNWDLTMRRVLPFIDGINNVKRISHLADADLELTRQCVEHLLYYRCIIMIDTFQFSNMYTVRPTIASLADDEKIASECASYVTRRGFTLPTWPKLLSLYSSLRPSITLNDWIEENEVDGLGIDVRRFVTFGVIKGFLRRVHRYPVLLLGEAGAQFDRLASASSSAKQAAQRDGSPFSPLDRMLRDATTPTRESNVELTSPGPRSARSRADRQETSEDFAWVGGMFAPPREGEAGSSSVPQQLGQSARRRGLPHAPSGQLNQRKMRGAATVLDVASVALDMTSKERMQTLQQYQQPQQQPQYPSISTSTLGPGAGAGAGPLSATRSSFRSPIPRALSSSTIRGNSVRYSSTVGVRTDRDGAASAMDGDATRKAGGAPITIPDGLMEMLDGTQPDDAFCVRFNRSWNDVLRLLLHVGMSQERQAQQQRRSPPSSTNPSGFSLQQPPSGGQGGISRKLSEEALGTVAGESDVYLRTAGGAASGFAGQMSGFARPVTPGQKTSFKESAPPLPASDFAATSGVVPTPTTTSSNTLVAFPPPLPRFRKSSANDAGNNGSGGGTDRSDANNNSGSAGFNTLGRRGMSNSMSMDDLSSAFHNRQRIQNGDLGRIQLIIK